MAPFDGYAFAPVTVPTAPFDFDTASPDARLLELARMLEDEQAWRDTRMEWDFANIDRSSRVCGTAGCAIGLAAIMWPNIREFSADPMSDDGEAAFDLTGGEWGMLFSKQMSIRHGGYDHVTPGHVATAIRQFVTNRTANPSDGG